MSCRNVLRSYRGSDRYALLVYLDTLAEDPSKATDETMFYADLYKATTMPIGGEVPACKDTEVRGWEPNKCEHFRGTALNGPSSNCI